MFEGSLDCTITLAQRLTLDPACVDKAISGKPLFSDRMVIAVARDNPLVGDTLTYDEFCALPYVETRFGGNFTSIGEQIVRRQPRRPRVRFWLPNFQQSLSMVAHSEMVTLAPSILVQRCADALGVRAVAPPLALPMLEENLYWHPRNDNDPGHRWFRGVIADIVAEIVAEQTVSSSTRDLTESELGEGCRLAAEQPA